MTPVIAQRLGAKVIKLREKGKGRQMREAVLQSQGEILIFMDGDGTDSAQFIPKLLEKLGKANLVLGCRNLKNNSVKIYQEPGFQKSEQMLQFTYPISLLLGLEVPDALAGFRAIKRIDWDKLNLKSDGFEIETEMNISALENNFIFDYVAIPNIRRAGGVMTSKFLKSPKSWLKIMKMIMDYKKNKPH